MERKTLYASGKTFAHGTGRKKKEMHEIWQSRQTGGILNLCLLLTTDFVVVVVIIQVHIFIVVLVAASISVID